MKNSDPVSFKEESEPIEEYRKAFKSYVARFEPRMDVISATTDIGKNLVVVHILMAKA